MAPAINDSKGEGNQHPVEDDWNLFAEYRRFRQNPVRFVSDMRRTMTGVDFAAYNKYTGARLYERPNWRKRIKDLTLKQPVLQKCIEKLIDEQIEREEKLFREEEQRAAASSGPNASATRVKWTDREVRRRRTECRRHIDELLDRIANKALPTFSSITAVRFEYFFISQTLSRAYMQGMHISPSQVERLRAKAAECAAKKQSLVLFPCHKSHVDYIALVYTFFRIGLSLPVTIAGDNLDIPLVSWFIKQVGATFIRRGNWRDDPLYTAFFQALINTYLQEGMNIQVFIEGTRSRTGKLLPPRYGLLKFICEAITSGAIDDCWIVPVSTQYDKVVEADTYATELMGREKKRENLKSFLDSRSMIKVNLGRIDVRISEGFSLRQFIADQLASSGLPPLSVSKPPAQDRAVMLRALAYRVLGDINRVSVVMPSALVGTVLLTTRQRGLSLEDLVFRVRRLINRVVDRGGHVGAIVKTEADLSNDDIALMVAKAIEVLGPDLVTVESKRLLEPVCYAKDEFKLSYYRNQVVHLFVPQAIVCTCLYQHFTQHLQLTVDMPRLKRQVLFLSRLLSGEFVFNSSDDGINQALLDCLADLKRQGVIESFDAYTVRINPDEVVHGWVNTYFYSYLVWPFIDGYWSAALTLSLLPRNVPVKMKDFLDTAQRVANTLFLEGALTHVEACNREVIVSAVSQADARKLAAVTRTTITLLASAEDVLALSNDISRFRNEVMKRPANSELLSRVEQLARPLVEQKAKL